MGTQPISHDVPLPVVVPAPGVSIVPAVPARPEARPATRALAGWLTIAPVSVLLLVLILIPRLADLDALVTADERFWIARSGNFYEAVSTGQWQDTYQYVHPGVPVMALGALGYRIIAPDLPEAMDGQAGVFDRSFQAVLTEAGYSRLDVLIDLRRVVTIASALVLIATFLCLTRIVPVWTAAGAIAFVSLDPLHIGFTRLLHLDGLSTNLLLLSLVSFSWHLHSRSRKALVIAGIATGLACLTRSANAVLGPLMALMVFAEASEPVVGDLRSLRTRRLHALRTVTIWGAIAGVTCVALWPALWMAPLETLKAMLGDSVELAGEAHFRQILFRGEVSSNDPGWTYYLVVLLYRISPLTVAGLVLAAIAGRWRTSFGIGFPHRLVKHLLFFSVAYGFILTMTTKKHDRYLLPSIVVLDLIAAFGWICTAVWLMQRLRRADQWQGAALRFVAPALIGVVLLAQAGLASASRPFYINEATPLLGGERAARDEFSFNWGENGKEIAAELLTIDGVEGMKTIGGLWPQTIDIYLPFDIDPPLYTVDAAGAAQWQQSDLVILTYPEQQRQLYPEPLQAWFATQTPIRTVSDDLGVYARIYLINDLPLPEAFGGA